MRWYRKKTSPWEKTRGWEWSIHDRTVDPQRPELKITRPAGCSGERAAFQASLAANGIRVRRAHVLQRGSGPVPALAAIRP
jgi:hypothetical protein